MNQNAIPNNFNPDRVDGRIDTETTVTTQEVIVPARTESITRTNVEDLPGSTRVRFDGFVGHDAGPIVPISAFYTVALGTLLTTIAANSGHEVKEVGPGLDNPTTVESNLSGIGIDTVVEQLNNETCEWLDTEFEHRFITKDANGDESFNFGAFMIPLQLVMKEKCQVNAKIEINVNGVFARTFMEAYTKNPEARKELVDKLKTAIKAHIKDELVIQGLSVAGLSTDSLSVYNREANVVYMGKNTNKQEINLPIKTTEFKGFNITSFSSPEAGVGKHGGPESLTSPNPENLKLSNLRLDFTGPSMKEALVELGVPKNIVDNIKEVSIEHALTESEVDNISNSLVNAGLQNNFKSNKEFVYDFVGKLNTNDPQANSLLSANNDLKNVFNTHFFSKRGVVLSFEYTQEKDHTVVSNIGLTLALGLLFFIPKVRLEVTGGGTRTTTVTDVREIPATTRTETVTTTTETFTPTARRIFDSNQPLNGKHIEFGEAYNQVETVFGSDSSTALKMFFADEIALDMNPEQKEMIIDYIGEISKLLPHLQSKRNGTMYYDEFSRKLAENLCDMWQRHDEQVLPMKISMGSTYDIDLSDKMDYKQSKYTVGYARLLSEHITHGLGEILVRDGVITTDSIRNFLNEEIAKSRRYERNVVVQTTEPVGLYNKDDTARSA